MKRSISGAAIGLVLFASQPVIASTIIDTGPGPSSSDGTTLNTNQSLAAEFSLDEDYTITAVEGWIVSYGTGLFTASIFSGGGDVPGSVLFSSQFGGAALRPADWQGAHGLSWNLAAGTYWVGFSADPGIGGAMPTPSPNPLGNEAFTREGSWFREDSLSLGVRISGNEGFNNPNVGAVPEPSTWAMMLVGFGAVGGAMRSAKQRRKATVSYA
jgi:hypothetical protein